MKGGCDGKIRIIFVSPFYIPFIGGAEISLDRVMEGLKQSGKVITFLITSNQDSGGNFLKAEKHINAGIRKVGFSKKIAISDTPTWKKQLVEKHYLALNDEIDRMDLIYLNSILYLRDLKAFGELVNKGKPIIIKVVRTEALEAFKETVRWVSNYQNVYFHCISEQIGAKLLKLGISNTKLFKCPNPIDTRFFHSKTFSTTKAKTTNYIYTGKLAPQKNIPGLVDIFNRIRSYDKKAHLTIIGRNTHPEMFGIIKKLKKTSLGISWLEEIPNKRIGRYLRKSNFFLMASRDEGMSNSLLEAMSCGLCPIVPATVSGMKDLIINTGNGFLYQEHSIDKFARRVAELDVATINKMGLMARKKWKKCALWTE
jgi:glycosyltransferase involved in cell wall biosynthesis